MPKKLDYPDYTKDDLYQLIFNAPYPNSRLKTRVYNSLRRHNISTVSELVKSYPLIRCGQLRYKKFGTACLQVLEDAVATVSCGE